MLRKLLLVVLAAVLIYVGAKSQVSTVKEGVTPPNFWDNIRYFKPSEFDSPDEKGSGYNMNPELIRILDQCREICGFPFQINSGYRTKAYNESLKERGYNPSPNSAHMKYMAVDIHMPSLSHMYQAVTTFRSLGIKRIGQYHTKNGNYFIHVDNDNTKPYQGEWYYRNGQKTDVPHIP